MEYLCLLVREQKFGSPIQAYMPHESSEDSSNQPDGPLGSHICPPWPLNDDTKNLTETDTETFFRYQIFRNRNQYPQKIGKSFETEKFRNRNVNLWCWPESDRFKKKSSK